MEPTNILVHVMQDGLEQTVTKVSEHKMRTLYGITLLLWAFRFSDRNIVYCNDKHIIIYFLADINECSSNPCVNGPCVNGANQYTCTCDGGWTGTNCDEGK